MENTHGGMLLLTLKVTLLDGCFSRFLNCTNGTKSDKAPYFFSASISFFFFFFQWTDSLKSCIKQTQSYLKSQKIKNKFNLEILCNTVFIGKLQKLHFQKQLPGEVL